MDYFNRDELIIENCIPTAEGALQIAMEELPTTVFGSKVLILGFGRVAKATAQIFKSLGAKVHIAARKRAALAEAKTLCYSPVLISGLAQADLSSFSVIINTIPAVILSSRLLTQISRETLIIDLASKPGGVDFDAASSLDLKVVWALSLPLNETNYEKLFVINRISYCGNVCFKVYFQNRLSVDHFP